MPKAFRDDESDRDYRNCISDVANNLIRRRGYITIDCCVGGSNNGNDVADHSHVVATKLGLATVRPHALSTTAAAAATFYVRRMGGTDSVGRSLLLFGR